MIFNFGVGWCFNP